MPIVKEMEGDAAWDEWNRVVQQEEAGFAPTAPASLEAGHGAKASAFAATQPAALEPAAAPAPPPKPKPRELTLEQVLQEARRDNRVCPKPEKWLSMYALLAARSAGAPLPPAPLTGEVWNRTPTTPKRMCFVEHVEWAAAQGLLPAVHEFLKSLGEKDWHYAA
jgi:hypothetical protein